jgi:hypothetical protein
MAEKAQGAGRVQAVDDQEDDNLAAMAAIPLDVAVAEKLTGKMFLEIISAPTTWLPALMYMVRCSQSFLLFLRPQH